MVIDRPANYGWPFCVTQDIPYQDYDFATQKSSGAFDCAKPVNDSRNNTGRSVLPPVENAEIVYGYGASVEFPELGTGGIGPMGGPVYQYDKRNKAQNRWPQYFDGKPLFYEWTRDQMKAITLGKKNQVLKIEDAIPTIKTDGPIDAEFGPDGALYVLEYGTGYFAELPEAQLSRIDFTRGNRTPEPKVAADLVNGTSPLTVQFSSAGDEGRRRRRPALRVGLRRRRHGRLQGGEPEAHVHRQRGLRRHAEGHRQHRAFGLRVRPRRRRQQGAGRRAHHRPGTARWHPLPLG